MSLETKDQMFSEGMTEELISALSKIAELRVIARTSIVRYKSSTKSIKEIGRELNVAAILEGSVRREGNKIRIGVQLADPESEEQLWSVMYDRDLEDVFTVQSEIAQKVANELEVQIHASEKRGLAKKATGSSQAFTLYLEGRHYMNTRTEEGLRRAIDFFEKALTKDQGYALAHSSIAESYSVLALLEFLAPTQAFPKARTSAERSLEIDKNLAEAHTSLGVVKFQFDWDWSQAQKEFRRGIELNPSSASAHQFYADFLKSQARFDEALAEMGHAQALDPLSLAINTGLGHVLYLSRKYDRAIEQYKAAIKLNPEFIQARLWYGRPFLQKHMFKEAITELKQAAALSNNSTISLAMLGHAYASANETKEGEMVLERLIERSRLQYVPSYWIAMIYIGLKDKNNAFAWLEKAFVERSSWLVWAGVEPRFDYLRSDPRFTSLMGKMNLKLSTPNTLGIRGWLKGPTE